MSQTEKNILDMQKEEYAQLAELVMKLQQNPNDERAFEALYKKTYQRVLYTARHLVNDEEAALDVAQEVYITLFRHLAQIREPRAIIKWLHQTTASKARDMRTRAAAQKETLLAEEQAHVFTEIAEDRTDFVPHEQLDAVSTQQLIGQMLRELPEEQSQTLIYRFAEGLPIAEIAELMGCTVSTVKSRIKYGKQKMETQVTDLEKKGIKLYSFSLPMLFAALRSLLFQQGALPAERAGALLGRIEGALGISAAAAGTAQAAAASSAAAQAGAGAPSAAAAGAAQTAAAAGAAGAKAGGSIMLKVVAGMLAASAIAGGSYAIPKALQQNPPQQTPVITEQQEIIEPQEDTRTPEQRAMQTQYDQADAYLDVINSLTEQYGERWVVSENTQTGSQAYGGLLLAQRIDFDADGVDELLCAYNSGEVNEYGNSTSCRFAVYGWDGQRAYRLTEQELGLSNIGNNSGDIFGSISLHLVQQSDDPKTYIYFEKMPDLEYQYSYLQTLTDGVWTPVFGYTLHYVLPGDFTSSPSAYDEVTDTSVDFSQAVDRCNTLKTSGNRIELSQFYPNNSQLPEDPAVLAGELEAEMEQIKTQLGDVFREKEPADAAAALPADGQLPEETPAQ